MQKAATSPKLTNTPSINILKTAAFDSKEPPEAQSFMVMQNILADCPNTLDLEVSLDGVTLRNRLNHRKIVIVQHESILSWGSSPTRFVLRVQMGLALKDLVFATSQGNAIKACLKAHCSFVAKQMEVELDNATAKPEQDAKKQTIINGEDNKLKSPASYPSDLGSSPGSSSPLNPLRSTKSAKDKQSDVKQTTDVEETELSRDFTLASSWASSPSSKSRDLYGNPFGNPGTFAEHTVSQPV